LKVRSQNLKNKKYHRRVLLLVKSLLLQLNLILKREVLLRR
jgi:hypothetical protein